MIRRVLPFAVLVSFAPAHADPASQSDCDRLRTEIAKVERAKRQAMDKQQNAWKAVVPFAVIAKHSTATSDVAEADKRLNELHAELTRRECSARNAI